MLPSASDDRKSVVLMSRRAYDDGLVGSDVSRGVRHAITVSMQVAGAGCEREGADSLPEPSHEVSGFFP
jgi:hypothetical protein